jgi:hypothetical protein
MMERIPVQSSDLASVGYDLESATLEVEFLKGAVYQYYGVPESVYNGLMNAPSKGRFLDQFVKKAGYSYSRIA